MRKGKSLRVRCEGMVCVYKVFHRGQFTWRWAYRQRCSSAGVDKGNVGFVAGIILISSMDVLALQPDRICEAATRQSNNGIISTAGAQEQGDGKFHIDAM